MPHLRREQIAKTVSNEKHSVGGRFLGVASVGGCAPGESKDEAWSSPAAEVHSEEKAALARPWEGDEDDAGEDVWQRVRRANVGSSVGKFLDDHNGGVDRQDLNDAGDHCKKGCLLCTEAEGF